MALLCTPYPSWQNGILLRNTLPGCSSVSIELTHQRLYSARSRRRASRGANGGDGDDGPLGSARLAVRRGRRRHLQAGTCKRHIRSANSAQQAVPSPAATPGSGRTLNPKVRVWPDRRPRASATPQARRKSRGVGRNRPPPPATCTRARPGRARAVAEDGPAQARARTASPSAAQHKARS